MRGREIAKLMAACERGLQLEQAVPLATWPLPVLQQEPHVADDKLRERLGSVVSDAPEK